MALIPKGKSLTAYKRCGEKKLEKKETKLEKPNGIEMVFLIGK